jgi:hypothetical protein
MTIIKHEEGFRNSLGFIVIWNYLRMFGDNKIFFNEYTVREGLMYTDILGMRLCSSFVSGLGMMHRHLDKCCHNDTREAVLNLENDDDWFNNYYFPSRKQEMSILPIDDDADATGANFGLGLVVPDQSGKHKNKLKKVK